MKKIVKSMITLLCAAVMALPSSFGVQAAEDVDTDRESQLTLDYAYDGKGLSGARFELYRTADITEAGEYVLSGDFADYPVNLKHLDSAGWKLAADTLSVYINADKPQPIRTGTTDENGRLSFDRLPTGLYLVRAGRLTAGNETYDSEPFFASLPSLGEDGVWNYDVQARPKTVMQETKPGPEPDTPSGGGGGGGKDPGPSKSKLTVIKVWNDGGSRALRPSRIKVALLRDGEEYKEATLSASNHWRHTWTGLSDEYSWEAVESGVPDDYSVTYSEEDTVYTITNSVTEEIDDGDVPRGSFTPEDEITIPDGPVPLAKLPQTGLLWWPVPLLLMAGLLLLGLGCREYISGKKKQP